MLLLADGLLRLHFVHCAKPSCSANIGKILLFYTIHSHNFWLQEEAVVATIRAGVVASYASGGDVASITAALTQALTDVSLSADLALHFC
jgi:hypothetical protein